MSVYDGVTDLAASTLIGEHHWLRYIDIMKNRGSMRGLGEGSRAIIAIIVVIRNNNTFNQMNHIARVQARGESFRL